MAKSILDQKINDTFPGPVIRKDLVKSVRSNAPVPGYVLEYLLGMYCATDDEATIAEGIEQVKEILRVHYVNRIDSTYDPVDFWFEDLESGEKTYVQTLEEKEFPDIYKSVRSAECRVRSEETNADSSEATLMFRLFGEIKHGG